jgi:hypothetical protein
MCVTSSQMCVNLVKAYAISASRFAGYSRHAKQQDTGLSIEIELDTDRQHTCTARALHWAYFEMGLTSAEGHIFLQREEKH